MPVEDVHELGKVSQRPAETVDLVDHHHIDKAVLDILKQELQGRAVQRGP